MDDIRSAKLFKSYPLFLRGKSHSIQSNLMPFGFECGAGWYALLSRLFKVAEQECRAQARRGIKLENLPIAVQVKEKFGTLRVYVHGSTPAIGEAIREAEKESACTCESCGKPSRVDHEASWISTICQTCQRKRVLADAAASKVAAARTKRAVDAAEVLARGYETGTPALDRVQRAKAFELVFSVMADEPQSRVQGALAVHAATKDVRELVGLLRKAKRGRHPRISTYRFKKLVKSVRAALTARAAL